MDFDFEIDGLAVRFFNRTVFSANTWNWSFGDMASSTVREPRHTYAASGTYTVTLTATCGAKVSMVSKILKINSGPAPSASYIIDTTDISSASEVPGPAANQQFEPYGAMPTTYLNLYVLDDSNNPLLVQSFGVGIDFSPGDLIDATSALLSPAVLNLSGLTRTIFINVTVSTSGGDFQVPILPDADVTVGSATPVTVPSISSGIDLITTAPPSTVEVTDCPGLQVPNYNVAQMTLTLESGLPPIS